MITLHVPSFCFLLYCVLEGCLSKEEGIATNTSTHLHSQPLPTACTLALHPRANILLEFSAFSGGPSVLCVMSWRILKKEGRHVGTLSTFGHPELILQASLCTEQCAKCQGSNIHFYPDYNPFFLKTEAYAYAYA